MASDQLYAPTGATSPFSNESTHHHDTHPREFSQTIADAEGDQEVPMETEDPELAQARKFARDNFNLNTCPPFRTSTFIRGALDKTDVELARELSRPSAQRGPPRQVMRDGSEVVVEYDIVHFKTDTVDRTYTRQALHHDIALAMYKQTVAEDLIIDTGYSIAYAVGDAQAVLLLDYLKSKAISYEIRREKIESNPVTRQVWGSDGKATEQVEQEIVPGQPHYVRQITEESIVSALEALTAPCIMFCVRKQGPDTRLPYQACAFVHDIVDEGRLSFGVDVKYFELPLDRLPTQPPGFYRKEDSPESKTAE